MEAGCHHFRQDAAGDWYDAVVKAKRQAAPDGSKLLLVNPDSDASQADVHRVCSFEFWGRLQFLRNGAGSWIPDGPPTLWKSLAYGFHLVDEPLHWCPVLSTGPHAAYHPEVPVAPVAAAPVAVAPVVPLAVAVPAAGATPGTRARRARQLKRGRIQVPDGAWESMKRAATARTVASADVAALPVQALVASVAPVAAAPVALVAPVAAAPLPPPPPGGFFGRVGQLFRFF